ncbi:MAG: sulfatase-like hydrolase/transferase, partial [Haemophilus parainfluenzae]|nr:sulfatase-like hydrolase/transferase [Haemophilus parainfluenzae]
NLPIAAPLKETIDSSVQIVNEWQKLKKMSQESNWGQSTLENSKYQDYVIILGESARKDYLHAYGYPVNDTPFMSSVNGTLIDGMTSAGTNTVASLRLMLTLPDKEKWEPNYDLSLVDLIKSAGLKTYWLSNQGFLGEYDTPVASLASKSDETIFLKKGGSFNSTNYSDFDLIPKFAQVLEDPTQGKRFIVLHIYGSHPLACDRVENQNCHSQLHHNIPLFKISSDDTARKEYKAFKSGLNFLEGIANWIGIKNPKLTLEEDLFSEQADKDDYGLKKLIEEKYRKDADPKLSVTASDFCNFSCEIFFFFLDTFTYF